MRARVLKVEGEQVTLGVFHQGEWWRMSARTHLRLEPLAWIFGELIFPGDGSEVKFRIDGPVTSQTSPEPEQSGSLDLEA